jgi:hypothetical protein
MALLIRLLMVSFLMGLGFNLPFLIYFKSKEIKACQAKDPAILQKICAETLVQYWNTRASYCITLLYMLYIIMFKKGVDT